jgi:hypothetical protein
MSAAEDDKNSVIFTFRLHYLYHHNILFRYGRSQEHKEGSKGAQVNRKLVWCFLLLSDKNTPGKTLHSVNARSFNFRRSIIPALTTKRWHEIWRHIDITTHNALPYVPPTDIHTLKGRGVIWWNMFEICEQALFTKQSRSNIHLGKVSD